MVDQVGGEVVGELYLLPHLSRLGGSSAAVHLVLTKCADDRQLVCGELASGHLLPDLLNILLRIGDQALGEAGGGELDVRDGTEELGSGCLCVGVSEVVGAEGDAAIAVVGGHQDDCVAILLGKVDRSLDCAIKAKELGCHADRVIGVSCPVHLGPLDHQDEALVVIRVQDPEGTLRHLLQRGHHGGVPVDVKGHIHRSKESPDSLALIVKRRLARVREDAPAALLEVLAILRLYEGSTATVEDVDLIMHHLGDDPRVLAPLV